MVGDPHSHSVTQNTRNDADTVAPTLMIIGGDARESANGTFIDIGDPADSGIVGRVPRAGDADVDAALHAAAGAFEAVAGSASARYRPGPRPDCRRARRGTRIGRANSSRSRPATPSGTRARLEVRGAADVGRYFGGKAGELEASDPLGEPLCATHAASRSVSSAPSCPGTLP